MANEMNWSLEVPRFGDQQVLQDWIAKQQSQIDDHEFAARFQKACPIKGVSTDDYLARRISTGKGELLAGIRFVGGDTTKPFVDVFASTGHPDRDWTRILADSYARFHPRWVRLAWPADAALPWAGFEAQSNVDQHFFAGLASGSSHASIHSIRPATDLSWYDDFAHAFSEWQEAARNADDPVREEVYPASHDEFQSCLSKGHVVIAIDECDRFLGVAAMERSTQRSFSGWCMIEEFVATHAQRKGMGSALQRSLMSLIEGQLLWGTIHATNVASQNTARKCGREVVETWWFVSTTSNR